MNILLDTHILLWLAFDDKRQLSNQTIELLNDFSNKIYFSTASLWEIAIKSSLGKPNFNVDVVALSQGLLGVGCYELPILLPHIVQSTSYSWIHKDPFDRLLLAQADVENLIFITADQTILAYQQPFVRAAKSF